MWTDAHGLVNCAIVGIPWRRVHLTWPVVTPLTPILLVVEGVAHLTTARYVVHILIMVVMNSGRWSLLSLLSHVVAATPTVQPLVLIDLALSLWVIPRQVQSVSWAWMPPWVLILVLFGGH